MKPEPTELAKSAQCRSAQCRSARPRSANGSCLAVVACLVGSAPVCAQERVTFPSLDGKTTLVASLRRPQPEGPRPALVLLHGCSGLQTDGRIFPVYRAWSQLLAAEGYVALSVDSAGSRGFGATCTASAARSTMLADRPKDAYAALQYLQAQPFVRADRIGAVGWSQGGATVLNSIAARSKARPQGLAHDFRAAVAFYPGACSEQLQSRPFTDAEPQSWTTAIALLVLLGDADNWTPAGPCVAFIAGAKARVAALASEASGQRGHSNERAPDTRPEPGSSARALASEASGQRGGSNERAPIELKLYPGALHVFDAPNLSRRELPEYRMQNGVVPIVGTDAAARADALVRVPKFLKRYLDD